MAALAGAGIFAAAKGAIHEIEAFILFLIAAVLFSAAAVIDAIITARRKIEDTLNSTRGTKANPFQGISATDA